MSPEMMQEALDSEKVRELWASVQGLLAQPDVL
jgi:hypothetical protein